MHKFLDTVNYQTSLCSPVQTWGLDSNVGADEHVGLKQRLREGDHQGLKESQGRGISLLHDLPVHVHVWQSHALPQPAEVPGRRLDEETSIVNIKKCPW